MWELFLDFNCIIPRLGHGSKLPPDRLRLENPGRTPKHRPRYRCPLLLRYPPVVRPMTGGNSFIDAIFEYFQWIAGKVLVVQITLKISELSVSLLAPTSRHDNERGRTKQHVQSESYQQPKWEDFGWVLTLNSPSQPSEKKRTAIPCVSTMRYNEIMRV